MDTVLLIFLSSGLFLGWSLGANDAANVFGTAVGTRMISFRMAAIICSVFVILGAVISGSGASHTLGKLGTISAQAGAFTTALTAALTVLLMTKNHLPVSTGQAIVGAIIGWNIFSGQPTSPAVFSKILLTWALCPLLAAIVAVVLYILVKSTLKRFKLGLFRLDAYTRIALIISGAFGSYSLGANNIANVMGVFTSSVQFTDIHIWGITLTSTMQLFFLGGLAISVGVFTYSKHVMLYVGDGLMRMTPVLAWVIVMAHSIVLLLFSSQSLHDFLISVNLPPIPLVPVSSSQAIIGGLVGIGLYKKLFIDWKKVLRILGGWILTPIISIIICIFLLFVVQNLFGQIVN